jgi:hypothetical protein
MSTKRINDRLFPETTWDHGWSLSLQADRTGYQCAPHERFETLEEYTSVEGVIYGPFGGDVDPLTLDLPEHVANKFVPLEMTSPSIGCKLTWDDVEAIKQAILRASLNPNAGVPRGVIGWAMTDVYHGTSSEAAEDIIENGIAMHKSDGGYFGQGFYVAEEEVLARSNYADFSDDEDGGVVIKLEIKDGARILDMRNAEDAEFWVTSGLAGAIGECDFAARAVRAGVDGLYDRSFGGLVIYNPDAVECLGLVLDNRPGLK